MRHFLTVTANVRAGVGYCLPVRLLQEPRNLNGRFTISDDSGHSSLELVPSIINNDHNPGAYQERVVSRLEPGRARAPRACRHDATPACLPHAWPPRLVARIRTDERVPRVRLSVPPAHSHASAMRDARPRASIGPAHLPLRDTCPLRDTSSKDVSSDLPQQTTAVRDADEQGPHTPLPPQATVLPLPRSPLRSR